MKKLLVLSILVAIVAPAFGSGNDAVTDFERMIAQKMLEKSQQPKDM